MVERFNHTIKDQVGRMITYNKSVNWVNKIQDIIKGYNESYHRGIGKSPLEVINGTPEEQSALWDKQYPHVCEDIDRLWQLHKDDLHLNVGDWVLAQKKKETFEHGFTPRWTREKFRIRNKCLSHGEL